MSKKARRLRRTVLMVLLLMALVVSGPAVEYCWLYSRYQVIAEAAREACRLGTEASEPSRLVMAYIEGRMGDIGLGPDEYHVALLPEEARDVASGSVFEVRISVPYDAVRLTPLPVPLPDALVAETTMRKEGP